MILDEILLTFEMYFQSRDMLPFPVNSILNDFVVLTFIIEWAKTAHDTI